jgi:hypothetical protein
LKRMQKVNHLIVEKGWRPFLDVERKTYTLLGRVLHQASNPEAEPLELFRLRLDLPVMERSVLIVSELSKEKSARYWMKLTFLWKMQA